MSTMDTNAPTVVPVTDRYCIRCGYALDGLSPTANCPECGTAVELSLRESTLAAADPVYRDKVHAGLSLVLNAFLLMIIGGMLSFFLGVTGAGGGSGLALLLPILQLLASLMLLLGYWKYTEPDPGQVMREGTQSARTAIRMTVIVQLVCSLVVLLLGLLGATAQAGARPSMAIDAMALVMMFAGLASLVAWIVQFISVMRYTRWLASRVPDDYIIRRTHRYMWLLPVVAIVGLLLFFLGPLIALIMYWNLLDRLRKHFKSIKKGLGPANLKGRLPRASLSR